MSSTLGRRAGLMRRNGHTRGVDVNTNSRPGFLRRIIAFLTQPPRHQVDRGLRTIRDGLGVEGAGMDETGLRAATAISVCPTESMARSIFYTPDMDGQADPGEIVWIWAPSDGADQPPRERALVVVSRTRSTILGLLISSNPEHDEDTCWLEIGSGSWDDSGRQTWVRLDLILEVPELGIRRQGVLLPHGRFERIANKLRSDYGWG